MDHLSPDIQLPKETETTEVIKPLDLSKPLAQQTVDAFFEKQYALRSLQPDLPQDEKLKLRDYIGFMAQGRSIVDYMTEMWTELEYKQVFVIQRQDAVLGICLYFAHPSTDGKNQVHSSFVGVDYHHLKQGLATRLVKARHEQMRLDGVQQYLVSVWDVSYKTISRAGGHLSPDPKGEAGKDFIVTL